RLPLRALPTRRSSDLSVTINIAFTDESALGTLDVSWSLPLADAVNGNFPEAVNNSTGTMAPVATILVNTINTLGPALAPILGPRPEEHTSELQSRENL